MSGWDWPAMPFTRSSTINARARFRPRSFPRARTRFAISVPAHRVWLVGCLERADLFGGQTDIERPDGAFEMFDLGGSNYRRGDAWLLKQPCQRDLRRCNPQLARHFAPSL